MTTEHPDELLRKLASAPDVPPPASLWTRVEAGRRRQLRQRRVATGIAGSALVLAMVTMVPWTALVTHPDTTPAAAASTPDDDDVAADVRAIDQALQVAYSRGASDDELTPLWSARQQALARTAANRI